MASRDCTLDLGVVAVAVANADSVVVVKNVAANAIEPFVLATSIGVCLQKQYSELYCRINL